MDLQYLPHSAMASALQSSNLSGLNEVNHAEISITESGSWPGVFIMNLHNAFMVNIRPPFSFSLYRK